MVAEFHQQGVKVLNPYTLTLDITVPRCSFLTTHGILGPEGSVVAMPIIAAVLMVSVLPYLILASCSDIVMHQQDTRFGVEIS